MRVILTLYSELLEISALGFLHSRTNLSPFTKDFRGGDQLDEYLTIFRGLALSRPSIRNEKYSVTGANAPKNTLEYQTRFIFSRIPHFDVINMIVSRHPPIILTFRNPR